MALSPLEDRIAFCPGLCVSEKMGHTSCQKEAQIITTRTPNGMDTGVPTHTLALALALVMFTMGADLNIVSPFLIDISHSYHVSLAAVGWLVTAFAAGYIVASPVAGWLSDRSGRVPTLAIGMAAFVVFETASGLAPTLLTETVARALSGVAAGAVSPVAYSLVGDVVAKPERPRVMSILSMGFSASTVAGVPLGLWLSTVAGWRGTLLAIGAALAVSGAGLLVLLFRLPRVAPVPRSRVSHAPANLFGQTWPQLTASFMAFAAMGLVYTYLPTMLVRRGLAPTSGLMAVLAGYGVFNLAGNALWGRLGGKRGARVAVLYAQVMELGTLVLLVATSAWAPLILVIAASWLFAAGQAYIPDLKALAADVPMNWRGTSLAFNNTAMYGGMMVGSAAANGVFHVWGFPAAGILGGIAICLGILAMVRARPVASRRLQGV